MIGNEVIRYRKSPACEAELGWTSLTENAYHWEGGTNGQRTGDRCGEAKLDVVLLNEALQELSGVFANSPKGFEQLQHWLNKGVNRKQHVCLEATGQYSDALAEFLHQTGYAVNVVNPARIKAFSASRLSRQKTDQTDARLIALFCQSQHPEAWMPPAPEQRVLQAMVRHLHDVKPMRQLDTIPGLGELSKATLLAEVPDILAFETAAQFAAYAGVTPRHFRSGSSVQGRSGISNAARELAGSALVPCGGGSTP